MGNWRQKTAVDDRHVKWVLSQINCPKESSNLIWCQHDWVPKGRTLHSVEIIDWLKLTRRLNVEIGDRLYLATQTFITESASIRKANHCGHWLKTRAWSTTGSMAPLPTQRNLNAIPITPKPVHSWLFYTDALHPEYLPLKLPSSPVHPHSPALLWVSC